MRLDQVREVQHEDGHPQDKIILKPDRRCSYKARKGLLMRGQALPLGISSGGSEQARLRGSA